MLVAELAELVSEGRARIIGIVRQELLSGIKSQSQFGQLQQTLRSFRTNPSAPPTTIRSLGQQPLPQRGIAVAVTDMLLCALSELRGWPIFTSDSDFRRYATVLAINLHEPRRSRSSSLIPSTFGHVWFRFLASNALG